MIRRHVDCWPPPPSYFTARDESKFIHSFAIGTRRGNQRLLPLAERSRYDNLLDLQVVVDPEPRLPLHGKRAAVRLETLALPRPGPLLVPVRVDCLGVDRVSIQPSQFD